MSGCELHEQLTCRNEGHHDHTVPCPDLCRAGCIQVSEATRALLPNHTFTPTGGVEVKGKVRY